MQLLAARRRVIPRDKGLNREFRRSKVVGEMDIIRHGWWQLLPTIWKRRSCAASAENSNRLAWLEPATPSRCSRWFAGRRRWAGMILALVGRGRSLRSATGRKGIGSLKRRFVLRRAKRLCSLLAPGQI